MSCTYNCISIERNSLSDPKGQFCHNHHPYQAGWQSQFVYKYATNLIVSMYDTCRTSSGGTILSRKPQGEYLT